MYKSQQQQQQPSMHRMMCPTPIGSSVSPPNTYVSHPTSIPTQDTDIDYPQHHHQYLHQQQPQEGTSAILHSLSTLASRATSRLYKQHLEHKQQTSNVIPVERISQTSSLHYDASPEHSPYHQSFDPDDYIGLCSPPPQDPHPHISSSVQAPFPPTISSSSQYTDFSPIPAASPSMGGNKTASDTLFQLLTQYFNNTSKQQQNNLLFQSNNDNSSFCPRQSDPQLASLDACDQLAPQTVQFSKQHPVNLPPLSHPTEPLLHPQSTFHTSGDTHQVYPGSSKLFFGARPSGILIIKKPGDGLQNKAMRLIADFLHEHGAHVYVEGAVFDSQPEFGDLIPINPDNPGLGIDFGITLGGDGTVLHYNLIFNSNTKAIPPVVCFSMGTLGFLAPFPIAQYKEILSIVLKAHEKHVYCCTRTRLQCTLFRKGQFARTYQHLIQSDSNDNEHLMSVAAHAHNNPDAQAQPAPIDAPDYNPFPAPQPEKWYQSQEKKQTPQKDQSDLKKCEKPKNHNNTAHRAAGVVATYKKLTKKVLKNDGSLDDDEDEDKADQQPAFRSFYPLNEVVLSRALSSMASIQLFIDGQLVTTVSADGLIISTPTGSSGYSMAAGGPMVAPSTPALIITPIAPHNLAFRPVVVCDGTLIRLRVSLSMDPDTPLIANFDGRNHVELYPGDSIQVRVSKIKVPTIVFSEFNTDWFESIKHKLFWNASPIY